MKTVLLLCAWLMPSFVLAAPPARRSAAPNAAVATPRLTVQPGNRVRTALARELRLRPTAANPPAPPATVNLTAADPIQGSAYILSFRAVYAPATFYGIAAGWTMRATQDAAYIIYPIVSGARDLIFDCGVTGASRVRVDVQQYLADPDSGASARHDIGVTNGRLRFVVDAQPVQNGRVFLVELVAASEWTLSGCRIERR